MASIHCFIYGRGRESATQMTTVDFLILDPLRKLGSRAPPRDLAFMFR